MNDTPAPEADTCAVCGKFVGAGGGFMSLQVGDRSIQLCCPMCLKVYQERVARAEDEKRNNGARELGWDEKW